MTFKFHEVPECVHKLAHALMQWQGFNELLQADPAMVCSLSTALGIEPAELVDAFRWIAARTAADAAAGRGSIINRAMALRGLPALHKAAEALECVASMRKIDKAPHEFH